MIAAIATAGRLDVKGWLLGALGATISGGAASITAGISTTVVDASDPDHFILKGNHILEVMAWTFAISAIFSLAKFLQTHPVPELGASEK
jgi:hypothetical protein